MIKVFNERPLSEIKSEREEQIRQLLEENSIDIYQAVAGLFEELLALGTRVSSIEKGAE